MKKMFLSAAALMIGAIAIAQVASPEQATVLTGLENHSNAAEVTQGTADYAADYQKARVRQVGLRNSAFVTQAGNALTVDEGNSADILQGGTDNAGEIAQAGKANLASIEQIANGIDGEGNAAVIAQGQNDAASSGNVGSIVQGTLPVAERNSNGA